MEENRWIRLLPVSATYTSPDDWLTATPCGDFNLPSALGPVPHWARLVPVESDFTTRSFSLSVT